MDKWMEIFRAGDYGAKGKYTAADLDTMVANYDPAQHEAPLVLGHPEHDAPAYGWVEKLKRAGDILMAKFRQVQPKVEQLIQAGSFKKRSISFYRDPLSLRHVGLLGAAVPEVKGLADLRLSDSGRATVAFADVAADLQHKAAFQVNPSPGLVVDPASIELAEVAQQLAERECISFGEALRRARTRMQIGELGECAKLLARGAPLSSAQLGALCTAAADIAAKEKISFSEAIERLRTQ